MGRPAHPQKWLKCLQAPQESGRSFRAMQFSYKIRTNRTSDEGDMARASSCRPVVQWSNLGLSSSKVRAQLRFVQNPSIYVIFPAKTQYAPKYKTYARTGLFQVPSGGLVYGLFRKHQLNDTKKVTITSANNALMGPPGREHRWHLLVCS